MRVAAGWARLRKRWPRYLAALLLACIAVTALQVLAVRWIDPWTSSVMLGERLGAMSHGDFAYRNRYRWAALEQVSPHAAVAVIAAEDQQFAFHTGFDFKSIREAVRYNSRGKRVRGASTISQQVAKNLYLWHGRSWLRKALEAWYTILIEMLWPKDRILEVYLNIAQMGRNVYGVEAASQQFFRKSAARLTRREAALLAAVLPNPRVLRVDAPSRYVSKRRDRILGQMRALGGTRYLNSLQDDAEPSAGR